MAERGKIEFSMHNTANMQTEMLKIKTRERQGAFFTPEQWVKKAQIYLTQALGKDWQKKYCIWDCAAGTGNLLAHLTPSNKIFASTVNPSDVAILQQRLQNKMPISHIFQFDFLNDDFSKLPFYLKKMVQSESEKLIIFINPPYAEATSSKTIRNKQSNQHKRAVSNKNKVHEKYQFLLKQSSRELFAQFFIRIHQEIPNCILASFSKLKYINSANFIEFRKIFQAQFLKGFVCPANTFDHVQGNFPIGFLIWNLGKKEPLKKITVDIFNAQATFISQKNFYAQNQKNNNINQWLRTFSHPNRENELCGMCTIGTSFQHNAYCHIHFYEHLKAGNAKGISKLSVNKNNFIPAFVYFSVRHAIAHQWFNDCDQFFFPNEKWKHDLIFQHDCLIFALFHRQNKITCKMGVNHFIPFSEKEINAKFTFRSHFLLDYLNGYIEKPASKEEKNTFMLKRICFSPEAEDVLQTAKKIWIYYYQMVDEPFYLNDAALYDIKEYFQGRNQNGRMNVKSRDEQYNILMAHLKRALLNLATKMTPQIFEFEFLKV